MILKSVIAGRLLQISSYPGQQEGVKARCSVQGHVLLTYFFQSGSPCPNSLFKS